MPKIGGGIGMDEARAQALSTYLQALAMLQRTDKTYVHQEIRRVIAEIEQELNIRG